MSFAGCGRDAERLYAFPRPQARVGTWPIQRAPLRLTSCPLASHPEGPRRAPPPAIRLGRHPALPSVATCPPSTGAPSCLPLRRRLSPSPLAAVCSPPLESLAPGGWPAQAGACGSWQAAGSSTLWGATRTCCGARRSYRRPSYPTAAAARQRSVFHRACWHEEVMRAGTRKAKSSGNSCCPLLLALSPQRTLATTRLQV